MFMDDIYAVIQVKQKLQGASSPSVERGYYMFMILYPMPYFKGSIKYAPGHTVKYVLCQLQINTLCVLDFVHNPLITVHALTLALSNEMVSSLLFFQTSLPWQSIGPGLCLPSLHTVSMQSITGPWKQAYVIVSNHFHAMIVEPIESTY